MSDNNNNNNELMGETNTGNTEPMNLDGGKRHSRRKSTSSTKKTVSRRKSTSSTKKTKTKMKPLEFYCVSLKKPVVIEKSNIKYKSVNKRNGMLIYIGTTKDGKKCAKLFKKEEAKKLGLPLK